jgi:membrane-associated phospholipid phosphatase
MSTNLRFFWADTGVYSSLLFLIALSILILLSQHLRHTYVVHLDQMVLSWFHSLQSSPLNHFFSTVTWMGSLWILLPLYLILTMLLSPHIHHFEKIVGITFWGTVGTVYFLKYELERARPHFFGPISELPIDPSFPSAHTAQITAFSLGILLALQGTQTLYKSITASLLVFMVLAVAFSRMYLQVHFATDVLAGFLVALMWAIIAFWIVKSGVMG